MPPDDTEIIDLTQDSPTNTKHHFIELDSDGEVIGDAKLPTVNGKASGRKRKKPRKKKTKDLEEGEVTQTSMEASREQSAEREKTNGAGGSRPGASRDAGAQVAEAKSLIDRLSGPGVGAFGTGNQYERDEDAPKERTRRPRIRRDRYVDPPPAKSDTRRRSRSPDRLRDTRDPRLPAQEVSTRQNGASGRRRREQSSERSAREPHPSERNNPNNLFFEDAARSEVPTTMKIQQKPTQPAQHVEVPDEPSAALLLPAHVSVLDQDTAVDPQQAAPPPESDSEDEGYIEYLDYDDDRRVRWVTPVYVCR